MSGAYRRTRSDEMLDHMVERVELLNELGMALSSETDPLRLQERILIGAMRLTGADGGTVYQHDEAAGLLRFLIMRTDSLGIALGGSAAELPDLPTVSLHRADGSANHDSVVAHAVLTGRAVRIDDAYHHPDFDFSGTRAFDRRTGYRSTSLLTVPMRNHEDEIIGVLQLLNARDEHGRTTPFSDLAMRLAESVASQAAIALTRHELLTDMQGLFESFVSLIADAIDEKSPYTGRHCRRVPELAMLLCEATCRTQEGPLAAFTMSEAEQSELRIAALLHDCGKITTPEWVMDKATKLQAVFDRIALIDTRYEVLAREAELAMLRRVLDGAERFAEQAALAAELTGLREERDFLRRINQGGEAMASADRLRLQSLVRRRFTDLDGVERELLGEDELEQLAIERGTLTEAERAIIQNHAAVSVAMLEHLPYPKHLRRIPEYAGNHHERMDGSGYPRGLRGEQMSIPARMMAIADVFEALTAADRPYKRPMPLSQALQILGRMAEHGHLDRDLYQVFIREGVWRSYAETHLAAEQRDLVDVAQLPGLLS